MNPIFIEVDSFYVNITLIRMYYESGENTVRVYYSNTTQPDYFNINVNEFKAKIDEALSKGK